MVFPSANLKVVFDDAQVYPGCGNGFDKTHAFFVYISLLILYTFSSGSKCLEENE